MKKIKFIFFSAVMLLIMYFVTMLTYIFVEPRAYDYMIKNVTTKSLPFDKIKNIYGHDDIVLVIIDDKSVEKYRWPWKRDLNNKIFNYFQEYAKPKSFVYDAIFITKDLDNPLSDKKYFETIRKLDNFTAAFLFLIKPYEDEKIGQDYDKLFTEKYQIKNIDVKTKFPDLYGSILRSPKEYIESVSNMGSTNFVTGFLDGRWTIKYGSDKIYRTQEFLAYYKDAIMPSLPMQSFLVANNNPNIVVDNKYISIPELGYKIKYIRTPFQLIVPIKFYKLNENRLSHMKYSAIDIMDSYDSIKAGKKPKIDPKIFRDKYVIYGAYAPQMDGISDILDTSIALQYSGADIQATCLDNLVHNDFLTVLPNWVNFLITIISMLLVYYTIRTRQLIKAIIYTFIIILLTLAVAACCFYCGIVINITIPAIMCILTMILAYIHRYVIEAKNKEKVESAMGRYMSEDVMKKVIQNIDNLGLGGKKSIVTVLFSDIRGFTSMSENMSAQEVSHLLNEYFSEMEPIVTKYNGIINKFIGDAIMAVFGEPIQDENHPLNAVKCGYEMLMKVAELDEKWAKESKPTIEIGVGINTGEVFVGNIGSEKRMEYTVIGDTVNLASRLESYNKTYKTHMLISSTTFEASKNDIEANKISDVEIRGKSHKMDIYEITNVHL